MTGAEVASPEGRDVLPELDGALALDEQLDALVVGRHEEGVHLVVPLFVDGFP